MGRLGNQMFQFSAGYSLSKKLNVEFKIPEENLHKSGYNGLDLYNCFDLSKNYLTTKNVIYSQIKCEYEEDNHDFTFNPSFFDIPDDTNLKGYFVSDKFFNMFKPNILNEFKFKNEIKNRGDYIITNLNLHNNNIVGIHVRRSDYMHLGEWVGEQYYINAIDYIKKIYTNPKLCIFSDDLNWCRTFPPFFDSIFLNEDCYTSMYIMSKIKNIIIGNSTFSWWGSYLNSEKCITIMPSKWLNNNIYDIFVDGWIKL